MAQHLLLAISVVLGLAALTLLTSLNDGRSAQASAGGSALRSLRSAGPKRDIWKGDDDSGMQDLLARESARLDAERSAAAAIERRHPAPGAKKQPPAATTTKNDDGNDRNDPRPKQQQTKNGDSAAAAAVAQQQQQQQQQAAARPNQPAVDEKESDRTIAHLLAREQELHSESSPSPKTLHLILPGPEPSHLPHVYAYSRRRAARQGWDTKVWKGVEVDVLVKSEYAHLSKTWEDIKQTPDVAQRVSKMGQFMKLVVLHSKGGVYLDADLVPCAGLDELVGGVRGPPAGIMSLPYGIEGADEAFAAPSGHPVLTRALKSIEVMTGLDGHQALKRAVTQALSVPVSAPPDAAPAKPSDDGWTTLSSVRLGSFPFDAPSSSQNPSKSELDLWHLDLSSNGGREFLSKCVKDTEDIAPFLEEGCRAPAGEKRGKFEDCGRTIA